MKSGSREVASSIRVCFVCLGNICRSPTAAGMMRHLVNQAGLESHIEIDSAGIGGWHVGEPPDARARSVARRRGVELDDVARQFEAEDFDRFDMVLAMDRENLADLLRLRGRRRRRAELRLLRDFDPSGPEGGIIPDPYFDDRFDEVFDLVEASCRGLLGHLVVSHGLTADR